MDIKTLFKEYYKYCLIGVFVTGMDFCILAFEVEILHFYYLVAAMISYIITAIVHYILSVKYVFTDCEKEQNWKMFLIFFLLGVVGLGIYEFFMWIFVDFCHIHYLIAKIFATGITFTFNFASRKFILFN